MSDKIDDFDDLFVNESEVFDTKLVKGILENFVNFTQNGDILLKRPFNELDVKKKLLIVLLSRKVLGFRKIAEESIGPKEVERLTGLPHSSVTMQLVNLVKNRLARSEKGKYWIPNHALSELEAMFKSS